MIITDDLLEDITKLVEDAEKQPIQSLKEIARKVAFPFRVIRCVVGKHKAFFSGLNDESLITKFIYEQSQYMYVTNNIETGNDKYRQLFQGTEVKAYKLLK